MRQVTAFHGSDALRRKSHAIIPGGAHTYAKGDDQYPVLAPGFMARGQGCHVWDIDGNEFIEYGMGLRSVTLGHAYPAVLDAVYRQMLLGNNFVRPTAIEVECAEQLAALIPSAEMVKFAKNGSDVTSAAVKLARAYTGRDMVAICADHPFFSVDDWFIGSTAMAAGVPAAARKLTARFHYNDIASLQALFEQYPEQLACVVMEPETTAPPQGDFLQEVKALCHRHGTLFVLDEIITGFRWHTGGAQTVYGVTPDLATFGKGMGNGFSVAALVGKRGIMQLGGLDHARERVFLLSTTYGAETMGLRAALETMRIYVEEDVVGHLHRQGARLRDGIQQAIVAHQLEGYFAVVGRPCNLVYATYDQNRERSQPFRTLFLQETIKRGLLMPSLVVSYSHQDADIDYTIEALGEALGVYRQALEDGIDDYLVGRPVKPVFRTFN